ncbi:MAG: hypothetical protein OXJ37_14935 [Bryobacterales bacterium]|nr:hypothetical protein [Bryobacterales bacterium]MDE0623580.1 hypothetical protein [Bryobacterales bacterium]
MNRCANLCGQYQAIRIERERQLLKSGQSSLDVSDALTSLSPSRPRPSSWRG